MSKDTWLLLSPLLAVFCLGAVLFVAGVVVQSAHILAIGCVCMLFMGIPSAIIYEIEVLK